MKVHKREVRSELRKEKDAALRTENLYRRGVRFVAEKRLVKHCERFSKKVDLSERRKRQLLLCVRRCMAEGLVLVGDELSVGRRATRAQQEFSTL